MATTEKHENGVMDGVMAGKSPDGWEMHDKYQIRHADGTPLKGKRYFVLRLDSDDPLEVARVSAAMSAYKGEAQYGNAAKTREVLTRILHKVEKIQGYDPSDHMGLVGGLSIIREYAKAALAEPPRQCDRFMDEKRADAPPLARCPKCGEDAARFIHPTFDGGSYVRCDKCFYSPQSETWATTDAGAAIRWNNLERSETCPFRYGSGRCDRAVCYAKWAQMPYNESEAVMKERHVQTIQVADER